MSLADWPTGSPPPSPPSHCSAAPAGSGLAEPVAASLILINDHGAGVISLDAWMSCLG